MPNTNAQLRTFASGILNALEQGWNDVATEYPELANFVDPLSGRLMTREPVLASDGHTYEREAVEAWIAEHDSEGAGSAPSPVRRNVNISLDSLTPNVIRSQAIQQLILARDEAQTTPNSTHQAMLEWDPHGEQPTETPRSVTFTAPRPQTPISNPQEAEAANADLAVALSRIFTVLDPLRELLAEVLEGWQPPQIVVIGDESAGKSTVLEQLAMLPVFPRNRRFCTRLAIHMRLRRSTTGESVAKLSVHDAITMRPCSEQETIPLARGFEYVQAKMDELIEDVKAESPEDTIGILSNRAIVLEIQHCAVPSIDLIDLPGLTQHPKEKAEITKKIVEQQVRHDQSTGGHAMYLAIVPASGDVRPNTNSAMAFVEMEDLKDRTFGVFTKCDQISESDIIRCLITGEDTPSGDSPADFGAVHLEKGWVASMLKVPQSRFSNTADAQRYYEAHPMERLYEQKRQETLFFSSGDNDDFKDLHERCSAGIGALVLRLEKEYSKYLSTTWKTQALKRVISAYDEKEFQLNLLGLEDPNEDNVRKAAVAEVERRLGCMIDELYTDFFNKFVEENVMQKLTSIQGIQEQAQVSTHELKSFLANMRTEMLAIVDDALASYMSYWMDSLEEALTAETKVVVNNAETSTINIVTSFWSRTLDLFKMPMRRRQVYTEVKKAPPFHLAGYPTFVEGILANQRQLFEDAHAAISEKICGVIEEAMDKGTPFLMVDYNRDDGEFLISALSSSSSKSRGVLKTGDRVCLTHDYQRHGDASGGPLKPGDVGEIKQTNHQYMVNYNGRQWWYRPEALQHVRTSGNSILLSKVMEIFAIHTPPPTVIRAQHDGVAIGVVNRDVAAKRRELQNDLEKVKRAQDGICDAFGVSDCEIFKLRSELDLGESCARSDFLFLKGKGQDGSEMFFKVKPSTKMCELFAAYASKKSIEQRSVKFLFDGNRIKDDDTPVSLGLKNHDEVDVTW